MTLFTKLHLSFIQSLIIFLLSLIFISCSSSSPIPAASSNVPKPMPIMTTPPSAEADAAVSSIYKPEPTPIKGIPLISSSMPVVANTYILEPMPRVKFSLPSATAKSNNMFINKSISSTKSLNFDIVNNYTLCLAVSNNGKITIPGPTCTAIVRVSELSCQQDKPPPNYIYAEKNISGIGQWVKLGLNAPDFQDINESKCMFIPQTGTEYSFPLYPKEYTKDGDYNITAYAHLFTSAKCEDPFNNQSSNIVEIQVHIETHWLDLIKKYLKDLWAIFWEKALWFWGALLTLSFTLILQKFKQRFEEQGNEGEDNGL